MLINLALQGGGAHGAFTWGVLDRLLDEKGLTIAWVSATSAGAVNAVALAAGLRAGGRQGAKDKLEAIWAAVHKAGVPDLMRLNPFLFGMTRAAMAPMAGLLSPYEFNPLGFDPLRRLLEKAVDFAAVRKAPIELLVTATELATGRARHFRRPEITVESVLASACLPTLHHAVQIDGRAYWDGGFSANPEIIALAEESPVADTLIVQLTPLVFTGNPRGAREIAAQVNRITFNAPLVGQVERILAMRAGQNGWFRPKSGTPARISAHRFHLIEASAYTSRLSADSKMKPDWAMFTHLADAGRKEAGRWLERHGASVGKRESFDLAAHFLRQPAEPRPGETTATRPRRAEGA